MQLLKTKDLFSHKRFINAQSSFKALYSRVCHYILLDRVEHVNHALSEVILPLSSLKLLVIILGIPEPKCFESGEIT